MPISYEDFLFVCSMFDTRKADHTTPWQSLFLMCKDTNLPFTHLQRRAYTFFVQKRQPWIINDIIPYGSVITLISGKENLVSPLQNSEIRDWVTLKMALQRIQFVTVIFFLPFSVFFVPGPINVMSDSATILKPTTPGVISTATDPPWMSRPGREISFKYHNIIIRRWSLGKNKVAGQMEPYYVTMREHREITSCLYTDIHRHAFYSEEGRVAIQVK